MTPQREVWRVLPLPRREGGGMSRATSVGVAVASIAAAGMSLAHPADAVVVAVSLATGLGMWAAWHAWGAE